jgi:nucleoside phosphorylase
MIKEVLDEAFQIQDERYRAQVLAGLAPYLPKSLEMVGNNQSKVKISSIDQINISTHSNVSQTEEIKPTVGIITALPKEYAAVKAVFENLGEDLSFPGSGAGRIYRLVEINSLNGNKISLVIANAGIGTNIAATRATLLLEQFSNLKNIIMVGIAGGVPNPKLKKVDEHVRLGDIVVSNDKGVIQYDFIKKENQENPGHRHPPRPPSAKLLELARLLEANAILGKKPWIKYLDMGLSSLGIQRPPEESDKLYKYYSSSKRKINHPQDPKRIKGEPRVFLGPIGSSNILQKDSNMRDKLRDDFGIKAIEMEGSGITDTTWNHEAGYLVVRGICDYCDLYINDIGSSMRQLFLRLIREL